MEIAWVIIQAIIWNLQVSQGLWWAVVDNGRYLLKGSVIGRAFSLASAFLCLHLEGTKSVQKTSEAEDSFRFERKKGGECAGIHNLCFIPSTFSSPPYQLAGEKPAGSRHVPGPYQEANTVTECL